VKKTELKENVWHMKGNERNGKEMYDEELARTCRRAEWEGIGQMNKKEMYGEGMG
jgi:hypothetical protein